MGEAPPGRCGFEMLAADVHSHEILDSDSLREAVESNRVAVCRRETVDGSERCRWHTDELGESGGEVLEVDHDRPLVLDGAELSGFEFRDEQSLGEARLRFADLSTADLSGVDLSGVDLSGADLLGADLSKANLDFADLSGADLPEANLSEANLSSANLSDVGLLGADLSEANLEFLDLSNKDLSNANLSRAFLPNTDLSEADLTGADLSEADLFDADLPEADLTGADLSEADLARADLSEVDLARADLSEVDLARADLSEADLSSADLSEADLARADLSEVDLARADLSEADLARADLSGALLRKVDLSGADLSYGDLSAVQAADAELRDATLERADLSKADIFDADLTGAALYGAILADIRLNANTKFGDHYTGENDTIERATWTLRQIEQLSRESALPERVTEAVVERKTRRRRHHWKEGNYLSWLRNAGFGLLTKYGESPGRVVGLSIGTILVSAGLFQHTGIRDTTSGGEVISFALQNTTAANLVGKSLYLSTVTFTILGYGDLQPVGRGQLVATVESFFGALLMALLVFVLGRRATR
ncbi:pentapeptide repeat-containing protein [Halobaculum sp. MBLA0147]|uniref:pentapeptide repeat-containing protein n=1 Tax=Halobaculum sp. MBLA0147 TaxID=3079934 RepID=UPI003525C057